MLDLGTEVGGREKSTVQLPQLARTCKRSHLRFVINGCKSLAGRSS